MTRTDLYRIVMIEGAKVVGTVLKEINRGDYDGYDEAAIRVVLAASAMMVLEPPKPSRPLVQRLYQAGEDS